ncbi:nickel-binding protein [Nocardia nova]|jgi:hypothetical protein|uniref:nickel-binding protein n=1 Tax=Nocardia nova TaxID=37330 RepID=UPI0018949D30|nr:nickel-binding protein [Nocardia nova]MBF6145785.1 DUF4242 domain-containing protein [Nocardia nova]MDN2496068.1 DUF4242 domain-containing protein [Nocardia nova]
MVLFIDVHEHLPEGTTVRDVAAAHAADVAIQGDYGVTYQRYWVDEASHTAFCLVDAPDADTAISVHREAHGLVPDRIYPVVEGG